MLAMVVKTGANNQSEIEVLIRAINKPMLPNSVKRAGRLKVGS